MKLKLYEAKIRFKNKYEGMLNELFLRIKEIKRKLYNLGRNYDLLNLANRLISMFEEIKNKARLVQRNLEGETDRIIFSLIDIVYDAMGVVIEHCIYIISILKSDRKIERTSLDYIFDEIYKIEDEVRYIYDTLGLKITI